MIQAAIVGGGLIHAACSPSPSAAAGIWERQRPADAIRPIRTVSPAPAPAAAGRRSARSSRPCRRRRCARRGCRPGAVVERARGDRDMRRGPRPCQNRLEPQTRQKPRSAASDERYQARSAPAVELQRRLRHGGVGAEMPVPAAALAAMAGHDPAQRRMQPVAHGTAQAAALPHRLSHAVRPPSLVHRTGKKLSSMVSSPTRL